MAEDRPPEASKTGATEPESASPGEPGRARPVVLRGTPVSPGVALGPVHVRRVDLTHTAAQRVPVEGVEGELNRLQRALVEARQHLTALRKRIADKVPAEDARILDVHLAYLKDSVFISDVENLILNEQLSLEAAIAKVVADFDRLFRLVQDATLRERAVDLRDVGIRILRYLEMHRQEEADDEPVPTDYVLAAPELTIVDMFNLSGEHVLGILTEAGSLTSHAAILARSMGIPTITGVSGLLDAVEEGDFVIVDASEGLCRIDPDQVVRDQYKGRAESNAAGGAAAVPEWARRGARTRDGERILTPASAGNLPEVQQAVSYGTDEIGLYRTELLYLVDKQPPSVEALTKHYASVISEVRGGSVTFRLLHADSSLEIPALHPTREANPALGLAGARVLLAREQVLRNQLQAILRAAVGTAVRIALPFVTDTGELRRVKEVLFEERLELRRSGDSFAEDVELGVVIETPASFLGVRDIARESDFLLLGLDSFVQYLLAADRDNEAVSAYYESLHPVVLRALDELCSTCRTLGKTVSAFGVTACRTENLPFLIGVGLRSFCVPPGNLREFLTEVRQLDRRNAHRAARTAMTQSCRAETLTLVDGFRHGYAKP